MNLSNHIKTFSHELYEKYHNIKPIELITNYHFIRDGKVFYIENAEENMVFPNSYKNTLTKIKAKSKNTFKVEGFEKYDEFISTICNFKTEEEYLDCHLYWGKEGKSSFIAHVDPYDVVILLLSGTKKMVFPDHKEEVVLKAGESVFIPGEKAHYADNLTENVSLSFGIRKYYKYIDLKLQTLQMENDASYNSLSENHGNLSAQL